MIGRIVIELQKEFVIKKKEEDWVKPNPLFGYYH